MFSVLFSLLSSSSAPSLSSSSSSSPPAVLRDFIPKQSSPSQSGLFARCGGCGSARRLDRSHDNAGPLSGPREVDARTER